MRGVDLAGLWPVPLDRWLVFWAVAARAAAVTATAPVFGASFVPGVLRVGLALGVSYALWPSVRAPVPPADLWGDAAFVLGEAVTGLAIGLMSRMAFAAVQAMGSLLDLDLGFGAASLLDPASEQPLPLLGNFMNLFATVVYLLSNAHYVLLAALAESFRVLPPGTWAAPSFARPLVDAFAAAFLTAVQLAVPVLAASFLVTVALAVLSRAVPQLNVFLLGLPVKSAVGLLGLALLLPIYAGMMQRLFPADAGALLGPLGGG
ncbi:MAG: flagellar biosynthetic protein FliR [Firmicutes bacterium]|nr:flagellar biosynthetic protein FliR [Bacillota bacterium]